jgi:uncharacterized membrane protein
MSIKVGVTIDAPLDEVWRVVEPIERHVEWMNDAESIAFTGPTTRGVGTTFDCVTRIGPFRTTDRMAVTEWEPGRTMGIEHRGLVRGVGRFTLGRRPGDRTHFTWTEDLQFPRWLGGALAARAAEPVLRRIWTENLQRLKQLVEGNP